MGIVEYVSPMSLLGMPLTSASEAAFCVFGAREFIEVWAHISAKVRFMQSHVSHSHHLPVKSIDLDIWTAEQMDSIQKWGNKRCNLYWEAHLKAGHVPPDHKIESFIRSKVCRATVCLVCPHLSFSTRHGDGPRMVHRLLIQPFWKAMPHLHLPIQPRPQTLAHQPLVQPSRRLPQSISLAGRLQ